MSKVSGKLWKRENIDQIKARIRTELAPMPTAQERFPFLLDQIAKAEEQEPDRLLYILTALHTHIREGGLSDTQVKELFNLAEALLTLQNIKPKVSDLAFLLGELHILQAQLHMNEGEPLLACIEQQLVEQFCGAEPPGGKAFQYVSLARMSLRMGEASVAMEYIDRALTIGLDPNLQTSASIMKLRALRLSHQCEAADELSARLLRMEATDPRWVREIQWEELCRKALTLGSIDSLMEQMNPRRDFYHASYILESFFWVRAVANLQWIDHLPKLKSLAQKKNLSFKTSSVYHRSAMYMERAYDKEIPLAHRLLLVKKIVQSVYSLPDIDKILLVLLALVRWLIRSQCRDLGRIVYTEYANLSQRLCKGPDALGIAPDLTTKVWR